MSEKITLYHGFPSRFKPVIDGKLDTSTMFQGNMQTGPGKDFAKNAEVWPVYGDKAITTQAEQRRFLHSRNLMCDELVDFCELNRPGEYVDPAEFFTEFILDLHKLNAEKLRRDKIEAGESEIDEETIYSIGLYNLATDYIMVDEKELLEETFKSKDFQEAEGYIRMIVDSLLDNEVRNFQIELAEKFNMHDLQKVWKERLPEAIGNYDKDTEFYTIVNDEDLTFKNLVHKDKKPKPSNPSSI